MKIKDLIERGYFPKELPPPFNTSGLANNIDTIISSWAMLFEQNVRTSSLDFVLTKETKESSSDYNGKV